MAMATAQDSTQHMSVNTEFHHVLQVGDSLAEASHLVRAGRALKTSQERNCSRTQQEQVVVVRVSWEQLLLWSVPPALYPPGQERGSFVQDASAFFCSDVIYAVLAASQVVC